MALQRHVVPIIQYSGTPALAEPDSAACPPNFHSGPALKVKLQLQDVSRQFGSTGTLLYRPSCVASRRSAVHGRWRRRAVQPRQYGRVYRNRYRQRTIRITAAQVFGTSRNFVDCTSYSYRSEQGGQDMYREGHQSGDTVDMAISEAQPSEKGRVA